LQQRFPNTPVRQGFSSLRTHVADRPGHDRRYAIDASKIASELGFAPAHGFEAGLADTVDWYLDNAPWWCAVLERGGQSIGAAVRHRIAKQEGEMPS
jgi:dTDP-glucose 4,6-dehydratase